jgi:hypothetical protein
MRSTRLLPLLSLLSLLSLSSVALSQDQPILSAVAADSSSECKVTKPNGQAPLGQPRGPDTYGNDALSTVLFPNGVVEFRPGGPGFVLADGSLKMKFPWWRNAEAALEITGRRLDATAPPLRAEIGRSGDIHMVPTYVIFPSTGCWEVSGKVGGVSLVFITKVVKVGNGP